jgi:hypothetical protein
MTTSPNADRETPEVFDAVPHVGRTLEQEGIFAPDVAGTSPEGQIAAEAGTSEVSFGLAPEDDIGESPRSPEPLKTRLPGDTSSDPHTDLGEDNASAVQQRKTR